MPGQKDLQLLGRLGIVLMIPTVLGAGPLIGYLLGSALDRPWHTSRLAIVGAVIGGVGSCLQLYRIFRWIAKSEQDETEKS